MKTIEVNLPEKLITEVEKYIDNGWFHNEEEVVRTALEEFLQSNKLKMTERYMKDDIEWALKQKMAKNESHSK
jgi:Arc/MetJ-type ribon-helix-helix transcriptional regulator